MNRSVNKLLLAAALASLAGAAAHAASTSNTFTARITIQADCEVTSPTDLDFSTSGLINSNIDTTSTFTVKCTNGTAYAIGLTGANDANGMKRMKKGSEYVSYQTYTDSGYSTVWDAATDASTGPVTSTGTGADQTYTVYGRVPPQNTPSAGDYTDTVTITVQY